MCSVSLFLLLFFLKLKYLKGVIIGRAVRFVKEDSTKTWEQKSFGLTQMTFDYQFLETIIEIQSQYYARYG